MNLQPAPATFKASHPDVYLTGELGERFSYCRGKLLLEPGENHRIVPCRSLLEKAVFDAEIEAYSGLFPGADRRALVSMWTMYYFGALFLSSAVSGFLFRLNVPAGLDELSLLADTRTAAPSAFLLPREKWPREAEADPEEAMEALLREHARPLVQAVAAHGGVSQRLLWNNISAYLSWIVEEIGAFRGPGCAVEGRCLMENECWRDGQRNPLHGTIRLCEKNGNCVSCRKVCCLRYALPGVCGCGDICPLPQGRA
ncbi:MAG: siderophore-iron reductase FhuF [Shinella sp.]|nr:siderophore-iron reductase FhuF [Shinella sp.]